MRNIKGLLLIFIMVLSLVGCKSTEPEEQQYVLADFKDGHLKELENNGVIIKVPDSWEVSIDEETDGKVIEASFDWGIMTVVVFNTDILLDLESYADEYKSNYKEDMIMNERQESYDNQLMEVFDWKDVSNDNKIHGTTYLFVTEHWDYNITMATYEEVSYEQDLKHIMRTFEFSSMEENVLEKEVLDETVLEQENVNEIEALHDINVRFEKDYEENNEQILKVYVKNNTQQVFTGNVHVYFYEGTGNEKLGADSILVEDLMPGQESWASISVRKYNGNPRMDIEYTNVLLEDIEIRDIGVDDWVTEKTQDSVRLNFDTTSWYNDIKDIEVYIDGTCKVVSTSTDNNTLIANAVWSCGRDYGVCSVIVVDIDNNIVASHPN